MIQKIMDSRTVASLFEGWEESVIWSCLQGVMGDLYADDREHPTCAMAILGDFAYYVGTPSRELVLFKPQGYHSDFVIQVPQNQEWASLIESCYGGRAKKVTRYAIKKEPGIFDRARLRALAGALPEGFHFQLINKKIYDLCTQEEWSRDFVAQYPDYEVFETMGLGVAVMEEDHLVCAASSYSSFQGGIEVEIGTREEYRHRGLATACGAKLILECMDRGLYPSWDARIPWSVKLAEKFGYHYSHDYAAYEIYGF